MKRDVLVTDKEKRDIVIYDILVPSLLILYEKDYFNIAAGVSERNICARLAHHMEHLMNNHNSGIFDGYFVDVEYNRMGFDSPKYYENHKHELKYMVSDMVIHSRGRSRNLLAVEMKRTGNNKNVQSDIKRLKSLVSTRLLNSENKCVYGTLVGAFILYSTEGATVDIFEDIDGRGAKTDDLLIER